MSERIEPMDARELASILEFQIPRPKHGHAFKMGVAPGVYQLYSAIEEGVLPKLRHLDYECDMHVPMRGGAHDALAQRVHMFFEARDRYARAGLLHKRGFMLDGPPGSGKSTALREQADRWADQGKIVFYAYDPQTISQSIKTLRKTDARRDVVVVLEDFDELIKYGGTQRMNQMLDGVDAPQHVAFIASVNDQKAIPMKLRRKGRFEERIHFPMPDLKQRFAYVAAVADGRLSRKLCEQIARGTDGAGFGNLRDAMLHIVANGATVEEAIAESAREVLEERREAAERVKRGISAEGYAIPAAEEDDCP